MDLIVWLIVVTMLRHASSLKCWNCIGNSCHEKPTKDIADQKSCQSGQSCQKVEYVRGEYNSTETFITVVRSCSMGDCKPTVYSNYSICLGNDRSYRINGCSTKTCCDDTDLCNGGAFAVASTIVLSVCCLFVWFAYS